MAILNHNGDAIASICTMLRELSKSRFHGEIAIRFSDGGINLVKRYETMVVRDPKRDTRNGNERQQ